MVAPSMRDDGSCASSRTYRSMLHVPRCDLMVDHCLMGADKSMTGLADQWRRWQNASVVSLA
jgi:hypothetical protein